MNRRLFALLPFLLVGVLEACANPWRPFDREAPEVRKAAHEIDAGDATVAVDLLTGYLSTGMCETGSIGLPDQIQDRPFGAYDLTLAFFRVAEGFGHRFGEEDHDASIPEPSKQARAQTIECALKITQAIASSEKNDLGLRSRAYFVAGNLKFLRADYKGAITEYDDALKITPGVADSGALGEDIAWNRAIALERLENQKNDASSDGSNGDGSSDASNADGSGDGGSPNEDSGKGDSGENDAKNDSGSNSPDAGDPPDSGPDVSQPPPSPEDGGTPPPIPPADIDQQNLDRLKQTRTFQEETLRANKQFKVRGLVDK